ncbi:MAG: hypothetical protein NT166_11645 [Candidatus Aminicenantes bacterium]|nr:hypothetical protein [Candidatus Aminicenantes bacterium]
MKWRNPVSFFHEKVKLDFVFVVICLSLLVIGNNATKDLTWPSDLDQFRDIAQTQTIMDGGYGSDPYYLNEHTWYNPGLHFMFGAASLIFNTPVPRAILRFGAFFIILAPLAFYFMLKSIFGPWPALIGSAGYLFISNPYPAWATSLYSPFIFPIIFSQAFFYLIITFFYKTIKKGPQVKHCLTLGVLLGLTFLINTSSAFIAGCMIALFFLGKMISELKKPTLTNKTLVPPLRKFLCCAVPAFIISLAFLCFVLFHYRLKIINPLPTNWEWDQLTLSSLPVLLKTELFYLPNIIAVFGFVHMIKKNRDEEAKKITLYWLGIVLAYLTYYLLTLELKDASIMLPLIVPAYHFFFYLKALSYVFFGYGAVILAGMLGKVLEKRFTFAGKWRRLASAKYLKLRPVFYLLLAAIGAVYVLTVYAHGEWLQGSSRASFHKMADNPAIRSYNWIRKNTKGDDVFLCSDKFSMRVVGPAARKVVATHPYFSNPYVDYDERNNDRIKMFECLESGEVPDFCRLCKKYKVKYVIETTAVLSKTHPSFQKYLKRVFMCGDVVIKKLDLKEGGKNVSTPFFFDPRIPTN